MDISELLEFAVEKRASDLILTAGSPPVLRIDGEMRSVSLNTLTTDDSRRLVYDVLTDEQIARFESDSELDFSLTLDVCRASLHPDDVRLLQFQLCRIFDGRHAFLSRNVTRECVEKRGFTTSRSTRDEHVDPGCNTGSQELEHLLRDLSQRRVVVKDVDAAAERADHEVGLATLYFEVAHCDRREFALELPGAKEKGLPKTIERGISQAMAAITLGGGVANESEALSLVEKIPFLTGQTRDVLIGVVGLLHDAYPADKWIEPILPDLLGEHLVQVELDNEADALLDLVLGDRNA